MSAKLPMLSLTRASIMRCPRLGLKECLQPGRTAAKRGPGLEASCSGRSQFPTLKAVFSQFPQRLASDGGPKTAKPQRTQ